MLCLDTSMTIPLAQLYYICIRTRGADAHIYMPRLSVCVQVNRAKLARVGRPANWGQPALKAVGARPDRVESRAKRGHRGRGASPGRRAHEEKRDRRGRRGRAARGATEERRAGPAPTGQRARRASGARRGRRGRWGHEGRPGRAADRARRARLAGQVSLPSYHARCIDRSEKKVKEYERVFVNPFRITYK